MIPEDQWKKIRKFFESSFWTSFHFAMATVNEDGNPHVVPIGSLILLEGCKGIYFPIFTRQTPANLKRNQRVCVLAVNSSWWFWLKSLFKGRFGTPPAMRLVGTAGEVRQATREEISLWEKRVNVLQRFKGYALLWGHLETVQEIQFHGTLPVNLGVMTGS